MRRVLLRLAGLLGVAAAAPAAAVAVDRWVSPRPALLALRRRFAGTVLTEPTPLPTSVLADLVVAEGVPELFDLVLPRGGGPHPLVVWLHGGGWFFGSRTDVTAYVAHLAAAGYAVAALDYPLAPESPYPAALRQLDRALPAVLARAAAHGADADRLVLAGTSAGAHLAALLAAAATDEACAGELGLDPGRWSAGLRGTLLHCGIYDFAALSACTGFFGRVIRRAAWAYTRDRAWATAPATRVHSPLHHVTPRFPPTFLSGGASDPFTAQQLAPMLARLRELDVDVETFTPDDPATGHDFQYDLSLAASQTALERSISHLDRVTARLG